MIIRNLALALLVSIAIGCSNSGQESEGAAPTDNETTTQVQTVTGETGTETTAPAVNNNPVPPTEPAQNAEGVWHYTCSAGCPGGAGSAIACAGCGATLAHNASYHNSSANNAGGDTKVTPPTPEPAQNAAGVWHYTCSAGCPGGAGTAQACSGCGATLQHNQAYHVQ